MIISHKHKFIFIHMSHTSGRSLTMDLVNHCGADDIITPTGDYEGQNCNGWTRHMPAREVKERIGDEIWDSYYTFCMDRNPWDKVTSNYWYKRGYKHKEARAAERVHFAERAIRKCFGYPWGLNTWLRYRFVKNRLSFAHRPKLPRGSYWFTDQQGNIIVDSIFRYECRMDHVRHLADRLQIQIGNMSQEGRLTRKTKRSYVEEYDNWSREAIRDFFDTDLKILKYEFGEEGPQNIIEMKNSNIFSQ